MPRIQDVEQTMRVLKVFAFLAVFVLAFLFSPLLGFLAQSYLLDQTSQNMLLSGIVQFGTQLLVSILVSTPVYLMLWGKQNKRSE